jgi:hypothetical protein
MSEPQPPPPQPPDHVGQVGGIVKIVQTITLTQVLIIALLVMIAIPTYILYRALNDESLLNTFLSRYEEFQSDKWPCTLRVASVRGGGDIYSISTGFAYQGSDRWTLSVILTRKPDDSEVVTYCATLNLIVDFLRRPDAAPPTFPNSDDPLIWQYHPDDQPEPQ